MKKVIFGIFAHPDDEAFGPSGTLLIEKAIGSEVHLICATAGQRGMNPDKVPNLGEVRLREWKTAGELIGADSMHYLGFVDGQLSNNDYMPIADKINDIVVAVTSGRSDISLEFMSIDHNGITGHLDHIAIGRIACYVYCNLKDIDPRVTRMRLACIPRDEVPAANCQWLYMDAGRTPEEIDETIDASKHLETIKQIMYAHKTQREDCKAHLQQMGDRVAVNNFLIL